MSASRPLYGIIMLLFALAITGRSNAQPPALQWQKCLGGSNFEIGLCIRQATDGGYIMAGLTGSNDGDVSGFNGGWDFWVVKMNSSGNIQWQKCLGGSGYEMAQCVQQTSDGGYILAGATDSNDGNVSGNHGLNDFWVVKLNSSGNIQWQRCLGGSFDDWAYFVQQTADGGFIVAGGTHSNDGDVSGLHNQPNLWEDYWVVKLDAAGSLQWQKCLGGVFDDRASSIRQTTDGGYILSGTTFSDDGDVSGNHNSYYTMDSWVIKLNASGSLQWQKCLGGFWDDGGQDVQQTTDGGYVVAGWTFSNDGDVSGNHSSPDSTDFWVVKLDVSGTVEWQKCLGGSGMDWAMSIDPCSDEGYIVAGSSGSTDGDVTGNHGNRDYWVVKLSPAGNAEWQKSLGGSLEDQGNSIEQTTDGGYIIGGSSLSNDGDVSGNHGGYDYWVVKLGSGAILPVHLLSFAGSQDNNAIRLQWQTTNELNTADFIIERSGNGIKFSGIGRVDAQNSSTMIHSYSYRDDAPAKGTNYYRLKIEDVTGEVTYSKIIRIRFERQSEIVIGPNPFSNFIVVSLTLSQSQGILISVYDVNGKKVAILVDEQMQAGAHQVTWNASDQNGNPVTAGIYFLHVNAGTHSETQKIILVR